MSLNEIKLSNGLLGELYGLLLVAPEVMPETHDPLPPPALLGNYQKKTLIVVNERAHAYLSDEDMKLLTGILTACNLSMDEIGILNLGNTRIQLAAQIHQQLQPVAWWLFGLDSATLGMDGMSDPGQTYAYRQAPVFWSPALSVLAEDPVAKRALWGQLKKHYGV